MLDAVSPNRGAPSSMTIRANHFPLWSWAVPLAALAVLAVSFALYAGQAGTVVMLVCATFLGAAVAAAVHHAEVIAHRVGEPFGTLVLALAVTAIEAGLIVMLMVSGGPGTAALMRDTVFAAVMIVCNGILGVCLLLGALRHREQTFHIQGASSLLAVLAALVTLTLVMPSFTTTTAGPTYSGFQLLFASIACLVLWGAFVFTQTIRHRDYFVPVGDITAGEHAFPPTNAQALTALGLLFASLVGVVGLTKVLSPAIENAVNYAGAPKAVVGVVVALLVLLPETMAAARAARANQMQTSLNLALGSGIASIGLTVPVIAALASWLGLPLVLGLDPKSLVLLALTFVVAVLTLATGRTNSLQGVVHLTIFAAFIVLAFVP
jgi:Ca2+:H+ antiporter